VSPVATDEEPVRADAVAQTPPALPKPVAQTAPAKPEPVAQSVPAQPKPVAVTAPALPKPVAQTPPAPAAEVKRVSWTTTPTTPPAEQPPAQGTAVVTHQQMLDLLRNSAYPEQREWAADKLALFDWRISPEIVDTLLKAACMDNASAVRVACVRSLVRMNAKTVPVVAAVQALKTDADPRVRAEADLALPKLNPAPAR
jgi:hypothetical protein